MPKKIDLTGHKYGRLTVINEAPTYYMKSGDSKVMWNCICDCGNTVAVSAGNLRSGTTNSCGCYQKEKAGSALSKMRKKHNRYEIKDDYVIMFTTNKNEPFYIDLEDLEKVRQYCWYSDLDEKNSNETKYIVTSTPHKQLRLHRYILNINDNKIHVDHINHNTFDNRKINLRAVTVNQNCYNRRKSKLNTSGVPGVVWKKANRKWVVTIGHDGKREYLGLFSSMDDAIKIRKDAEEKYFGEYSYDNSIKQGKIKSVECGV